MDLRYRGKLDPEIAVLFNDIAKQSRGLFTQIVSEISEPIKYNIDWWVEGPASRNPFASPFFHYFCSINLVNKLINNKYDISEIIVDSFALKQILKQYFTKNSKSILIKYQGTKLNYYFKHLIIPFYKIPNNALTLIDVFAYHEFTSKDRYYNGLWKNLNYLQKESTFFVPTLIMIPRKKMISAYKILRTSDRNFLVKEDYLKISDLIYAIGHYFRLLRITISPVIVLSIDISSLVKEELRSMKGYSNAVEGLLNYRFAKRIKEKKTKLRLVIDWFENQVVDKGWNAGFKKFYPGIPTIGYKGYITSLQYLCTYPSIMEDNSDVLPSRFAVIGKGLIESTRNFSANLNVEISPAFRFQHVWDKTTVEPNSYYFTILVALPIIHEESITILKLVKDYLKATNYTDLRFLVKIHPAVSEEIMKIKFGGDWPEEFTIIKGTSSRYIPKSDIIISGMSSICLETMSLGVPVIFVENLYGISYNPIPEEIPQVLWRSCRTSEDINNAIGYYRNRSHSEINKHKEIGFKIKEDYFEPVTKESVRKFLLLDTPNVLI